MKHKIDDAAEFKAGLLKHILSEWETQVDMLETQMQEKIDAASDSFAPYSNYSKKDLAEQRARVELSDLKTPLAELKSLPKPIPEQPDEQIRVFSLFDITVSELGRNKTTTYFVVPLERLSKLKMQIKYDGTSIVLTTRGSPFFGCKLNDRRKIAGGEIWEEPHMGHVIKTGRHSNDVMYEVSWIYK